MLRSYLLSNFIIAILIAFLLPIKVALAQGSNCGSATAIGIGSNATFTSFTDTDTGGLAISSPGGCGTFNSSAHRDVWFSFTATYSGQLTINYTPSAGVTAVLAVYQSASGTFDCATEYTASALACSRGTGTRTINPNIINGRAYRIRIIHESTAALSTGGVGLELRMPSNTPCETGLLGAGTPPLLTIGAAAVTFNLDNAADHTRADFLAANPTTCGAFSYNPTANPLTANRHRWARFTANFTGALSIIYTNGTTNVKDAVITLHEVVSGTLNCATSIASTQVACKDSVGATASVSEVLNFSVTNGRNYYIRVINKTDNQQMNGSIALRRLSNCSQATQVSIGNCLSVTTDLTGVTVDDSPAPNAEPNCVGGYSSATRSFAWRKFTATYTGSLHIRYASTSGKNVALVVYEANSGVPFNCANQLNNSTPPRVACTGGAATIAATNVNIIAGREYVIRIINNSDASVTAAGELCLLALNDACANAGLLPSTVIDNAIPANVYGTSVETPNRFNLTQGDTPPDPSCWKLAFTDGTHIDGWVRFNSTFTGQVDIEYNVTNSKDVAIAVYQDPNDFTFTCPTDISNANLIGCGDLKNAGEDERISINVISGRTYYIRVANLTDNQTLTGSIKIIPLNNISEAADACINATLVEIGSCNITANILGNYDFNIATNTINHTNPVSITGLGAGCNNGGANLTQPNFKDGWVRFKATFTGTVNITFTNTSNQNAALFAYEGLPTFDCATGVADGAQIACRDNAGNGGAETMTVSIVLNREYYIRVVNRTGNTASNIMTGTLCITPATLSVSNVSTAPVITLVGICGFNTNVPNTHVNNGEPVGAPSCFGGFNIATHPQSWVRFQAPFNGQVLIMYDATNNDGRPVMAVYTGTPPGSLTQVNCASNNTDNGSVKILQTVTQGTEYFIRLINQKGTLTMPGVLCLSTLSPAQTGPITISCPDLPIFNVNDCNRVADIVNQPGGIFIDNATISPFPLIPAGGGGCATGNIRNGWFRVVPTVSSPITIEYSNATGNAALEVYTTSDNTCSGTPLVVACGNISNGQGTERVSLSVNVGTTYFVRVMEITNPGAPSITKGAICVYTGSPVPGDYCSNAMPVQVGSCDITMPVLASQRNAEGLIAPACAASFNPVVNNDAWVKFTAQYGNTRIAYSNYNDNPSSVKDIAIALYGGSCSKLTLIACANDITGTTIGEEVIEYNTIAGTEYFVRIINLTDANEATGTICINNGLFASCAQTLNIDPNAPAPLPLNVCNYEVSIPATGFTYSGTPPSCSMSGVPYTGSSQEAWTRFRTGSTANSMRIEVQADKYIVLAIYEGLCPVLTQITGACRAVPGSFYQAIEIPAVTLSPNTDYFIRIINILGGGTNATICINENVAKMPMYNPNVFTNDATGFNPMAGLVPVLTPITDCSIQFNIATDDGDLAYNTTKINSPAGNASCGGTVAQVNLYADALAQFNGIAGDQVVIRYDSDDGIAATNQNDVIIEVYSGVPLANPGNLVACANTIIGEGVEELIFTPAVTQTYYIRLVAVGSPSISELSPSGQKTVFGRLCLNTTVPQQSDICATAKNIVVGLDCGASLNMPVSFSYLDATPFNCGPTALEDSWAKFTATSSFTSITYEHESNADVYLSVFSGNCGSLTQLACVAAIDRPGGFIAKDSISINIPTAIGVQYFVRIVKTSGANIGINNGTLCVVNTIAQNVCSDTQLTTVPLGTCNAVADIPIDFDELSGSYSGLNPLRPGPVGGYGTGGQFPHPNYVTPPPSFVTSADPDLGGSLSPPVVRQDAWFKVVGTGERMTIHYENINGQGNPAIAVYTIDPGPINCGNGTNGAGNIANEWAAANAFEYFGRQTETVIFNTIAGQQFLVRIMNVDARLDNPNPSYATLGPVNQTSDFGRRVNMRGIVCVFRERKSLTGGGYTNMADGETMITYDNYAVPRPVLVGDCDIPLNVLSHHTCNETSPPPSSFSCTTNAMPNTGNPDNTTSNTVTCQGDAWLTFTTPNTTPLNSGTNRITIQYNNNNFNTSIAPDVALVVYTTPPYTNANSVITPNAQANPHAFCSNRVIEGLETVSFIAQPNTTYYIRVVRLTTGTVSVYGRLCIFYGESLSEDFCGTAPLYRTIDPPNPIASVDGTWQPLEVSNTFGNEGSNQIPNCVVPGGSNPSLPNPAITRDAWVRFQVPAAAPGGTGYTVQYDNSNGDLISGNVPNVAIAIYQSNCPTGTTDNTLIPNACTNKLWEGVESLTFLHTSTSPVTTYYVRVMSVSTLNVSVQGKIRVTLFANCQVGPNLVRDGQFAEWGTVGMRTVFDNDVHGAFARYYTNRNKQKAYPNVPIGVPAPPSFAHDNNASQGHISYITSANPSDSLLRLTEYFATGGSWAGVPTGVNTTTANYVNIDRYARFATVNGYVIDNPKGWFCFNDAGGSNADDCGTNSGRSRRHIQTANKVYHNGGTIDTGEFIPEGRYTVGKNPQSWFAGVFFSFGVGFGGYGGGYNRIDANPTLFTNQTPATNTYCDSNLASSDACAGLTWGGSTLALPTPTTDEANFLMVNAWWKTPAQALLYEGNGKLWCQTIEVEPNQYFIFNAWFGNMIRVYTNLDLPQLIISVCDMENPSSPIPPPPAPSTAQPPLPGETYTINTFTHTDRYGITKPVTIHQRNYPGTDGGALTSATPLVTPSRQDVPATNRRRTLNDAPPMHYGASRSCNLFGEGHDARIKYLGTDIYLPEAPDSWIPIRCIYKSPNFTPVGGKIKINLCIENRSLTKNGNDLVVDGIFFAQCQNADATTFENYLKGNTCELSDAPIPGFALSAKLLTFGATYINSAVELQWRTTSEINNSHFMVERSEDGKKFTAIGVVKASGRTEGISDYNYTDRNLIKGVKRYYYRLKVVNKNNQGDYGPVTDVVIPMYDVEDLRISPNPIASGETLKVSYEAQEVGIAAVTLSTMMGYRISQSEVKVVEGSNEYELDTKGLAAGVYIVSVGQGTKKIAKKLVVY